VILRKVLTKQNIKETRKRMEKLEHESNQWVLFVD
jgi:hypothetical protein